MTVPRPGHADLTAAAKYGYDELRLGLERASARETAARVACGAVARRLLDEVGIDADVVRASEPTRQALDVAMRDGERIGREDLRRFVFRAQDVVPPGHRVRECEAGHGRDGSALEVGAVAGEGRVGDDAVRPVLPDGAARPRRRVARRAQA